MTDREHTARGYWRLSHRFDPSALPLADRHYNRRKIGSPQFVPPGRCLVLLTERCDALWVTSAPFAEYVRHSWAGAWVCSCFRNEGQALSSRLIREAVAVTRWKFGDPPPQGFVTFVDRAKTRSKRDPGYCYLMAGWQPWGRTKAGLYALGLTAEEVRAYEPVEPAGAQLDLWGSSRRMRIEIPERVTPPAAAPDRLPVGLRVSRGSSNPRAGRRVESRGRGAGEAPTRA